MSHPVQIDLRLPNRPPHPDGQRDTHYTITIERADGHGPTIREGLAVLAGFLHEQCRGSAEGRDLLQAILMPIPGDPPAPEAPPCD